MIVSVKINKAPAMCTCMHSPLANFDVCMCAYLSCKGAIADKNMRKLRIRKPCHKSEFIS